MVWVGKDLKWLSSKLCFTHHSHRVLLLRLFSQTHLETAACKLVLIYIWKSLDFKITIYQWIFNPQTQERSYFLQMFALTSMWNGLSTTHFFTRWNIYEQTVTYLHINNIFRNLQLVKNLKSPLQCVMTHPAYAMCLCKHYSSNTVSGS